MKELCSDLSTLYHWNQMFMAVSVICKALVATHFSVGLVSLTSTKEFVDFLTKIF